MWPIDLQHISRLKLQKKTSKHYEKNPFWDQQHANGASLCTISMLMLIEMHLCIVGVSVWLDSLDILDVQQASASVCRKQGLHFIVCSKKSHLSRMCKPDMKAWPGIRALWSSPPRRHLLFLSPSLTLHPLLSSLLLLPLHSSSVPSPPIGCGRWFQ